MGLKRIVFVLVFLSFQGYSQFQKMDSVGNFYVIDHKLVWQKWYPMEDKVELNRMLKSNPFTSGLDILGFAKSTEIKGQRLAGENLPEYAQHDYDAFLYLDIIGGRYRITIKQIVFPDFIEKEYYNGRRVHNPRGSLEQYILRQDGLIKRNNGTLNVIYSFDTEFSQIFDPMSGDSFE